jgi:hypothetical protein
MPGLSQEYLWFHPVTFGICFQGEMAGVYPRSGGWECRAMFRRPVSIVFLIYIIIGIVVAWTRDYITIGLIKGVLSALLATFLWFLPLLGVSLHLN